MQSDLNAGDIRVLLLVGGMGKRLRSVISQTPKPLASVGDASFLDLLLQQLRSQGFRHLVMCTGYLAEQIEEHFGNGSQWGVYIEYSRETTPLGTAGAVKLAAQKHVPQDSSFIAMNGDSFVELDFNELVRFAQQHRSLVNMAVLQVDNAARYGTVKIDSECRVIGFSEKTGIEAPGLVNAGVYVFDRAILQHIPEGPASLENDVFPKLLGRDIYALQQRGMFIDIGTPEDYGRAQEIVDRLYKAASGRCPSH